MMFVMKRSAAYVHQRAHFYFCLQWPPVRVRHEKLHYVGDFNGNTLIINMSLWDYRYEQEWRKKT